MLARMRTSSIVALGLLLGGCTMLTGFEVPTQVWSGQPFEVLVEGRGPMFGGGVAAAVLQMPNGFIVEGASCMTRNQSETRFLPGGGQRDDPAVLSIYTPEPGHYLASFSGTGVGPTIGSNTIPATGTLKVFVRAPAGTGSHQIKLSLAGKVGTAPFQAADPAGVTTFSSITMATNVKQLIVVAQPVTPFVPDTAGLVNASTAGLDWRGCASGDIDGDGRDDLVALVELMGARAWLSRAGAPWIERSQGLPFGSSPVHRLAMDDVDGDGWPDLAINSGQMFYGNGGTSWTLGPPLPGSYAHAVRDVDGDGRADIALASGQGPVRVFRSNGNRTFTELNSVPVASVGSINLLDVDGDGHCDLLTTPSSTIWRGDGQGNWTDTQAPTNIDHAVASDIDGDGQPELVMLQRPAFGNTFVAAMRWSTGAWVPVPLSLPAPAQSLDAPSMIALLDHDRDGRQDLAVIMGSRVIGGRSWMELWRNAGQGQFTRVNAPGLAGFLVYSSVDMVVGDYDGDSFPDLAIAPRGEYPLVWRNTATGLSPYGTGCAAGPFAMPQITATGNVLRGSTNFALHAQGGQPNGVAILWLGVSKRFANGAPLLPFDLGSTGAPGCRVLAAPDIVFLMPTDGSAQVTMPLPIPNLPSFERLTVFTQGAMLASGANALGLLFTAGLAVKVP